MGPGFESPPGHHVGAKSALLRRSFIPLEQKNVIRPLPCSSFPTAIRCAAVGGFAALRMRRPPCGERGDAVPSLISDAPVNVGGALLAAHRADALGAGLGPRHAAGGNRRLKAFQKILFHYSTPLFCCQREIFPLFRPLYRISPKGENFLIASLFPLIPRSICTVRPISSRLFCRK